MAAVLLLLAATLVSTPVALAQAAPVVPNPGFELSTADDATDWWQDAPGQRTFVDTQVARTGTASLRADLANGELSRTQVVVDVEPDTDYVARVWVKAESATADNWGVLVRDAVDKSKRGSSSITLSAGEQRVRVSSPQDLTIDWTLVEQPFNSESSTSISIMLAGWNGRSGSIWWDDVSVEIADPAPTPGSPENDHNWLHMSVNLLVDDVDDLLERVDRAKAAGATGVLVGDSKANNFSRIDYGPWAERMQRFRDEVRDRGMEFVMITTPLGFCQPLLADNVDLAAGYPIIDQPMRVSGDQLVPVETARVPNGGFERATGDVIDGADFQDAPGARTFQDTSVARSGQASLRADATGGQMSRLFVNVDVEPHQQYVVRVWIKTENLTAANVQLLVLDNESEPPTRRNFTNQRMSLPGADNRREFFGATSGLTTDWTQVRLAFNSLDASSVRLALGVFGGQSGSIWWDDLAIEAEPTLNWLNRAGLDQSIVTDDGRPLTIGVDTSVIDDPLLGEVRFSGTYDSYHQAPTVTVNPSAGVAPGDIVLLSGWHTQVTGFGQIGCSWNDPAIFGLIDDAHVALHELIEADGYLVNYSEVRTGGFEPFDLEYGSSGTAFAASISRAIDIVDDVTGDAELYVWDDMFSPQHNARPNYYQVAGDLTGSADGLDPTRVTVVTWASGERLRGGTAAETLAFFEVRGFEQILGGFYDENVAENHAAWVTASSGVDDIVGSVYATWVRPRDFSGIEEFGELWWSSAED